MPWKKSLVLTTEDGNEEVWTWNLLSQRFMIMPFTEQEPATLFYFVF